MKEPVWINSKIFQMCEEDSFLCDFTYFWTPIFLIYFLSIILFIDITLYIIKKIIKQKK